MIYSYINTRENWKNSKLCENTPPCGRRVSTQFLVFPISTRVDITVYQHGKCVIFLKYNSMSVRIGRNNVLPNLVSIYQELEPSNFGRIMAYLTMVSKLECESQSK